MTQELDLELVSYKDSWFTNAHDLLSHEPVTDGRGTFTHLGVKMEGLESARHINFIPSIGTVTFSFTKQESDTNDVEVSLRNPSRALVHTLVFDTSFFTMNNVRDVVSVVLVDELEGKEVEVVSWLRLDGNSVKEVQLPTPTPATRAKLRLTEGGLTRFKMLGTPTDPLPQPRNLLKDAKVFWSTDSHYGSPDLVLREQREGKIMAGWESRRHSARQAIAIQLPPGGPYTASKIVIDTYMHCLNAFKVMFVLGGVFEETSENILADLPKWRVTTIEDPFKLNKVVEDSKINEYYDSEEIQEWRKKSSIRVQLETPHVNDKWRFVLRPTRLQRDTRNEFTLPPITKNIPFTHLVFVGLPDGGVHRLMVYGDVAKPVEPVAQEEKKMG